MNSKIGLLGAAALLQLILIGVVMFAPESTLSDSARLLTLNVEAVTSLVISDGENEIEVSNIDDGWQVAGVPADADKVANMLDKLANLSATWPVATSRVSAERFEVSDVMFQRRVRITDATQQLAELYLGTSPGYQQVHARRAGSDDIYSVELSNYDLGVNVDGWMDKGLLAVSETPGNITVDFIMQPQPHRQTLVRGEEGWLYNGTVADQDAARTYANRLTTLRVLGIVEDDAKADADGKNKAIALATITLVAGDVTKTLTLTHDAEEDAYAVSDSVSESRYRLANYVAEQLLMTDTDFSVQGLGDESSVETTGEP